MQQLAENLWLLHYKLPLLGEYLGRNVAIIRLNSGELVIHSTGPFTPEDVAAITALGQPAYLVDALAKHDTFAKEGRAAFPGIPYYAPEGFTEASGIATEPLEYPPAAWQGELDVAVLAGQETKAEYAMLHRASRTLIVADLVFNIESDAPTLTKLVSPLLQTGAGPEGTGMPRPEKMAVKDPEAFKQSLDTILSWDFDRVIVGHGNPIATDGKRRLREALADAGF